MKFFIVLTIMLSTQAFSSSCSDLLRYLNKPEQFHITNFSRWINDHNYTYFQGGPAESASFKRQGVAIEGQFKPQVSKKINQKEIILSPSGRSRILGGEEYIEFPNSTALTTIDPVSNQERTFIMTRGVRPYKTKVDVQTGNMSPQDYVSDVLLFEQKGNRFEYLHTVLRSEPEYRFKFEDPRVSFFYNKNGNRRYFLSGTDYSPHVQGSDSPDVMNRFVELEIDSRGVPKALDIDSSNKEILFHNLSPSPKQYSWGTLFTDSKNATIYPNEFDEIVVRTRMRPDFNNPTVKKLFGDEEWKYGEQVFIFENFESFKKYNWEYALEDLASTPQDSSRISPTMSRILLKDSDLQEMYKTPRLIKEKGKGFGPGTIPVRIRRVEDKIYLSESKHAPEYLIGMVSENDFILKKGEVKYLTFDHEIRYLEDIQGGSKFTKRHYSATVKLFNERLDSIEAYFADVIQPKTLHELGLNSGIVDLQHVYPMGRVIMKHDNTFVRVFSGASDSHTTFYDFDIMTLLHELSLDSPRRASGQVYKPIIN